MSKIYMLAMSNIRKSKAHTISLGIMLIIAAIVLNLGLLMFLNYNSFFDKTANELNTSDCYMTIPLKYYNDDLLSFIENHSNVKEMESEYSIPKSVRVKKADNKEIDNTMLFFDNDVERNLTKKKFVGEYLPLDDNSVYVGYYFNIEWGYKLNDKLTIDFGNGEKEYTIKGFVEDIYYASPDMGVISGYFSENEFNRILDITDNKCMVCQINLYEDIAIVETEVNEYIVNNINSEIKNDMNFGTSLLCFHLSLCKTSRTMMAAIIAVMMVVLSLIITIICIIVIRFRIKNSIEEDMTKIGSLKAIGYTTKQIISSIVLQFLMISIIGCIIGIALSYVALPWIADVLSSQSALKWEQGFDLVDAVATLVIILLFVIMISLVTARKIKCINPIVALRGGITTHNFRKNYFPLDKTKGGLSAILGMKTILQDIKQSIMICIITFSVTFVGVFGLIMFYNTTVDKTAFAETPGMEVSNISLQIDTEKMDDEVFLNELKERDGVEFAQYISNYNTVTIEGLTIHSTVMVDYSNRRTDTIYEGRYPIHDNEIAINGSAAKLMEKKIGDTVKVSCQTGEKEYLITGFQQGMSFGGMTASITYSGYLKLYPDYVLDKVYVYLDDNVDTAKCLQSMLDDYGDVIVGSSNEDKEFEEGMGMYTGIVSKVGVAILCVSFAIIILVLYFVLNSLVIRQRRELGIQKAIGYTTIKLMNQIAFSVMPSIIIGIILGSIMGALTGNPIMSIIQRGMGIAKANYVVMPNWIVIFSIGLAMISYISSMLITLKIRKISAYSLVTE